MSKGRIVQKIQTTTDDEHRRKLLATLYKRNEALIRCVVRPYVRAGYEMDDALQDAFIGLVKAVDHYQEGAGEFTSYLAAWVRQTVGRAFMNTGNIKRLPEYLQRQIRNYSRALADAQAEGREPTDGELCAALGLSSAQLENTRRAAYERRALSLSQPIDGAEELTLADAIRDSADPIGDALENISAEQDAAILWAAVGTLEGKQADTIRKRYRDGLTLKEIADAGGVSITAIKQREKAALTRLRMNRDVRQLYEGYSSAIYHGGLDAFRRSGSVVERVAIARAESVGLYGLKGDTRRL